MSQEGQPRGERMINQEILDNVRANFIRLLEESIQIYTKGGTKPWVNEDVCRGLIDKIRDKIPTVFYPPLYAENFDGAVEEVGFRQGSLEYQEIRKAIEEGK